MSSGARARVQWTRRGHKTKPQHGRSGPAEDAAPDRPECGSCPHKGTSLESVRPLQRLCQKGRPDSQVPAGNITREQAGSAEGAMKSGLGAASGRAAAHNWTQVEVFVLQGFSEHPELRLPLLGCFLALYGLALAGNAVILVLISCSASLRSPMYFFLFNLASMDVICTSSVVPKTLVGLVSETENTISFQGCMAQLFFLLWSLSGELLLLTVMAYDRYVAICHPLHYSSIMSPQLCGVLAAAVWAICAVNASVHTGLMARLTFCGLNIISHFFCEIPSLLLLSCSSTLINSIMTILADAFYGVINFLLTLGSYGCIIASILRIRSAEGKRRAFSTCSSHLLVVTFYYSAVFCAYINPGSSYSPERNKLFGILYTMLGPALNPLIYSLRNAEVKQALRRLLNLCRC
ncbi:olfactory receptor 13A1-like [Talpa occidentalis]|uniref:olfactory receptor 13A1-like n=1 Tax=Talpa occidentalis TaxID=50954 RepID=UPI0023F98BF2|nr:olfactory receptor 13A1-like [Talpa occidentalis]